MTTEVKPILLLSYDKKPVVQYEIYWRMLDGSWRVQIFDKNGRLLHETPHPASITVLEWKPKEPQP